MRGLGANEHAISAEGHAEQSMAFFLMPAFYNICKLTHSAGWWESESSKA